MFTAKPYLYMITFLPLENLVSIVLNISSSLKFAVSMYLVQTFSVSAGSSNQTASRAHNSPVSSDVRLAPDCRALAGAPAESPVLSLLLFHFLNLLPFHILHYFLRTCIWHVHYLNT